MGPKSPLWSVYIDEQTNSLTYSIALARNSTVAAAMNAIDQNKTLSNITFGTAKDEAYLNQSSLVIETSGNFSYPLYEFGIGPVYYVNGAPSSSYYKPLPNGFPVVMNTNFIGMGAPAEVYHGVYNWLVLLEEQLACDFDQDGYCTLNYACDQYTEKFEDFVLHFKFWSNLTHEMRIPIATFAQDGPVVNNSTTCILQMYNLGNDQKEIILGGMFFQEFFTVFTNDYNSAVVKQKVQIYVGNDPVDRPFVGNSTLPIGFNPWKDNSIDRVLVRWVWLIIAIFGMIVMVLITILVLKVCINEEKQETRRQSIAEDHAIVYEQL